MTHIYVGAGACLFIGIIIVLLAFLKYRTELEIKKRTNGHPPSNRRERRERDQVKENFIRRRNEESTKLTAEFHAFTAAVRATVVGPGNASRSLLVVADDILALVESQMFAYQLRATKRHLVDNFMPYYYYALMNYACWMISTYSSQSGDMQSISPKIVRFMKANFKLHDLNKVLFKYKSRANYSDRCEYFTYAVIQFFTLKSNGIVNLEEKHDHFDYLPDHQMTSWEDFRKSFIKTAIDGTYASYLDNVEKQDAKLFEAGRRAEHQHNHSQRTKRLNKSKRQRSRY